MPLTAFQREVAGLLAANRNPNSHVAGGAPVNRSDTSPRYSADIDIFRDVEDAVATSARLDTQCLTSLGFQVDIKIQMSSHFRAEVRRGEDFLKLDWSANAAFRFFPAIPDAVFGYCLHTADLATNKVIAMADRAEIRDLLDVLYYDAGYLPLGQLVWAACGKDLGYTPESLIQMLNRHAVIQPHQLRAERLTREIDPLELKTRWTDARDRAIELCNKLPSEDVGALYLNASGEPPIVDPDSADFHLLRRHLGAVCGAWPEIS